MHTTAVLINIILLLCYFLPSYIAARNKKRNTPAIFVINLIFGWTIVGWLITFAWAITKDPIK